MKKLIALLLALGLSQAAVSCDVCGGAGMNTGFGYIPLQARHIVGINYSYNSFHTSHPASMNMMPMESHDRFHTADLWLRYFISPKVMATLSVPYRHNTIDFDSYDYQASGLGDINAQAYYSIWRSGSSNARMQALWLGGIGLKLPTGSYNEATDNVTVQNLQLGTGSWDALLGSNLSMRWNKLGFNHEMNYSLNGHNPQDFKYGNRFQSRLILFSQLKAKNSAIVPQLGLNYMHFDKDLIWASRGIEKLYSGREQLNTVVGLDWYKLAVGVRLSAELPLYQNISEGYVNADYQLKVQFLYFIRPFNGKKQDNEDN